MLVLKVSYRMIQILNMSQTLALKLALKMTAMVMEKQLKRSLYNLSGPVVTVRGQYSKLHSASMGLNRLYHL